MVLQSILLLICFIIIGIICVLMAKSDNNKKLDFKHVNEESFQKYAKFYGDIIPVDIKFNEKLKKIFKLIKDGEYDIKKIANESNCTIEECVLKIRYLKNKRLFGDYYIDTSNLKLLPCSYEDQELLDKYKAYIYNSHLQINEMANLIPNKGYKDIEELRKEVFDELVYLDKKGLLNGIRINTVDKKIIYYTIEKKKKHDYETIHCPNCGALNDVDSDSKVRCGYCNGIIKGTKFDENN